MGTNRALRYIIVMIGASVFFLLASTPADAKTPYDPLGPLSTNPIIKTVGNYLGENSTLKTALFGTHVTCGGGDQTKINLGPVIPNVSDCNECKELAACAGQKKGVSNVGYLWDAHTNQCGLGIPVTEAEARSCEEEDTCLGVDEARFREIKDDVLGAVDAVKNLKDLVSGDSYFNPNDIAPAELLLALTWVESKWDTLYGNTTYNSNLPFSCSDEETALNQMCSDINFELKIVDKHGKVCQEMSISDDPDGAGSMCDGKMGFAQILPSTYLAKTFFGGTNQCIAECGAMGGELVICVGICQSKNLIGEVTGELYPDPWNQHDGIYTAETMLTLEHANFDGAACVNGCVAEGKSIDTCLNECGVKEERCAIIDYHYGDGTCAGASAEQEAFADEVLRYKPVMKSLLDTGMCPKKEGVPVICSNIEGGAPGIDIDRLNEILPHELAVVAAANSIVNPATPLRAAFTLAHLKAESGWRELIGDYPADTLSSCGGPSPSWGICADEAAYFGPKICGDPMVALETFTMHGITCNKMTVTFDGGMGMASFQPSTWVGNYAGTLQVIQQVQAWRLFVDPFSEEDAMAANAYKNAWGLKNCGDERGAFFQYVSGNCGGLGLGGAPIQWLHDRWDQVIEPDMNTLQQLIDEGCKSIAKVPGCPLNPPFRLNSDYCPNDPADCKCYVAGWTHWGVDLSAAYGAPLFAVEDGFVELTGNQPQLGTYVWLTGASLRYLYAHLVSGSVTVSAGDPIIRGEQIGLADNTGLSFGDHLHFGTYFGNTVLDPREVNSCMPQVCGETINP